MKSTQSVQAFPAKPKTAIMRWIATATALSREATYLQFTPAHHAFGIKIPPFGCLFLIIVYFVFILALEMSNMDVEGAQHYQALGVRAGWLAIAQVPWLVLLAGKNNLVGLVSGVSYERLNIYHRWVARGLLLLATLHFGFQSHGWSVYGLMQMEWTTDTCPPTGIAAYALLLWMNLSTLAPFRRFSYDIFVAQHIVTFFGFIVAIMMHLPTTALSTRVYIYVPIALYLLDRFIRTGLYMFHNVPAARATLESLDGQATRLVVSNCRLKSWTPGSHVLLAIPRLGLAQSHPATIVSTPSSHNGNLVFILRTHKGFTRTILKAAQADSATAHLALVDGPYGGSHSSFTCFDTVLLIAGGTGVTFTLSVLLGVAEQAAFRKLPLRTISFVWVIKKRQYISWITQELQTALEKLHTAGIEVRLSIFVTDDDLLTDGTEQVMSAPQRDVDEKGRASDKSEVKIDERTADSIASAQMHAGRPSFDAIIWNALSLAQGETGIGVCGPISLSADVRRTVVRISDERAVHKGTDAQGIYLHVETFH